MRPVHDNRISRPAAAIALWAALAAGSAATAAQSAPAPDATVARTASTAGSATAQGPLATAARASASQAAAKVWQGAQDVAVFALGLIGVDYRYGGNTPDAGLDCSGLVRYVFQEVTGTTLPRTAKEMSRLGSRVGPADLAPGDLVFFNTRRFAFSHVGLYLGDGRFIHAPSAGGEVHVSTLSQAYWKKRFDGARRLVGVLPSLVPTLITTAVAAPALPPVADPAAARLAEPVIDRADGAVTGSPFGGADGQ
jgi:cell wall-associated NlpC family hydrolase